MKTLTMITIALVLALAGCKKEDDPAITPTTPDYQTAIAGKYKALNWPESADNGGTPVKTSDNKGYVQYYATKNRAIYYYPTEGSYAGGVFAMLKNEMEKYDALGQAASILGRPTVDYTVPSDGSGSYLTFEKGIIATTTNVGVFVISGNFYSRFVAVGGVGKIGLPTTDQYTWTTKQFPQSYISQKFNKGFFLTLGGPNITPTLIDQQFYTIWENEMKSGVNSWTFPDWPMSDTQVSSTGKRFQVFRWFVMYQASTSTETVIMRGEVFENYFKKNGFEGSVYGAPVVGWPVWDAAGKSYTHNFVTGKWIRYYLDTTRYDIGG